MDQPRSRKDGTRTRKTLSNRGLRSAQKCPLEMGKSQSGTLDCSEVPEQVSSVVNLNRIRASVLSTTYQVGAPRATDIDLKNLCQSWHEWAKYARVQAF